MLRPSATACVCVCVCVCVCACEREWGGGEVYEDKLRQTVLAYIHTINISLPLYMYTHTHTHTHTHFYLIHTSIDLLHALLTIFIVAFLQGSAAQYLDRDPTRQSEDALDDGDLCVCVCVCVCVCEWINVYVCER
jgi:hypothetical protein